MFRPLTTAFPGKVQSVLADVEATISTSPAPGLPPHTSVSERLYKIAMDRRMRYVPIVLARDVEVFRALWSRQLPVVVRGVHDILQGDWSPEAFKASCGNKEKVLMIESGDEKPKRVKASHFFEEFMRNDDERSSAIKVKVGRC